MYLNSHHLPLDPLHSATAASDDLGNLEDAMTGTKLLADGLLDLPTNRWATQLFDPLGAHPVEPSHDPRPDH